MRSINAFFVSLVMLGAVACGGEAPPGVLLEVSSEGPIVSLEVWVKRYLDDQDRAVVVESSDPFDVEEDRATGPWRVRIDLPHPGRYAVHLVGHPVPGAVLDNGTEVREGDRMTDTRCYVIQGEEVDRDVVLGLLPFDADADGDTFADSISGAELCDLRAAAGLPCDETCLDPEFNALVDCNPVAAVGCGAEVSPDEQWHPFASDPCGDCLDQDCWGGDAPCGDRDGDGFPGGEDCDDDDPEIHPGAEEICGNGIDENCWVDVAGCDDGDLPCDADGDGAYERVSETCGTDCDDGNPDVNPRQIEGCVRDAEGREQCYGCDDELDNNCDGRVNEGCSVEDVDNDGVPFRDPETGEILDCNDCNSAVGPAFPTVCGNRVDEDCDGDDEPCDPDDADGDGYRSLDVGGSDCDDTNDQINPGAPDHCGDGVAQNCGSDQDCALITDADGDHFGLGQGDCDDTNPEANPWLPEVCDPDGVDEDCDEQVNEILAAESGSVGCGYDSVSEVWAPIYYQSDPLHCGLCRHDCCPVDFQCEGQTCERGRCLCNGRRGCVGDVTDTCCPAGCANLSSDPNNCGACGERCARNEPCEPQDPFGLGACFCEALGAACPRASDWTACCDSGCVELDSDPHNCGGCGRDCTADDGRGGPRGDRCVLTDDGPQCLCSSEGAACTGTAWCTDLTEPEGRRCGCADLNRDPDNCGSCGARCGDNEICREGRCQCGEGGPDCGDEPSSTCCPDSGGCVDLDNDPRNCGECGNRCGEGQRCERGVCRCTNDSACDDGNRCTVDTCSEAGSCEHHTLDADGDGYCASGCFDDEPLTPLGDCEDSPGDCDDSNRDVHPGATESCETPYDDNCDGSNNARDARGCTTYFRDADHDTYGIDVAECWCEPSGDYRATRTGDCDDTNAEANPGESETCHTLFDDDCDGDTNDRNAAGCRDFFFDRDGDTWGVSDARCLCEAEGDYQAMRPGDCDDSNRDVHPGSTETCSTPYDDDCNSQTNEQGALGCTTYYQDVDDDGYGTAASQCWCLPTGEYTATRSGDCDDRNGAAHPGMTETCATPFDDDCNGDANEQDAVGCRTFYHDGDEDGYGSSTSRCYCEGVAPYTAVESGDCNNSDPTMNPGHPDTCDGRNDDCDGTTLDGSGECEAPTPFCCSEPTYHCCECRFNFHCGGRTNPDCLVNGVCGCLEEGLPCPEGWTCCPSGCEPGMCPIAR